MFGRLVTVAFTSVMLIVSPPAMAQQPNDASVASAGDGTSTSASLRLFKKTSPSCKCPWALPAWSVTLDISNASASPAELGGLLAIIQPGDEKDAFAASYLALHRDGDDSLAAIEERYRLLWGADITGAAGQWPIYKLSTNFQTAFALILNSVRVENPERKGFGDLPPRARRSITQEVLFPASLKAGSSKIVLAAPDLHPASGPAVQHFFSFDLAGLDIKAATENGVALGAPTARSIKLTPEALTSISDSDIEPMWMRLFALARLTEIDREAAEPVLLRHAASDKKEMRLAALANLSTWPTSEMAPTLAELLPNADVDLTARIISALAYSGNPTAIAALHPYLEDPFWRSLTLAALGRLRDPSIVDALLTELRKGESDKDATIMASDSLVNVGGEEVILAVRPIAADPNEAMFTRVRAFRVLQNLSDPGGIPLAATLLADGSTDTQLQFSASELLVAHAKLGNLEARAILTDYIADNPNAPGAFSVKLALGLLPHQRK